MPQLSSTGYILSDIEEYLRKQGFIHYYRITIQLGLIPRNKLSHVDLGTQSFLAVKNLS